MRVFVGKPVNFIFNARTVARTDTLNSPAEKRRAIKPLADNVVSLVIGLRDPTTPLLRMLVPTAQQGHDRPGFISPLFSHRSEIY